MSRPWVVVGSNGTLARALKHLDSRLVVWPSSSVDIRDEGSVEAAFAKDRPEVAINAAAWTDVDGAETNRDAAFDLNGAGPGRLAAAAQRHDARLIHVSTDYVFDGAKPGPYVEDDPVAPLGVYGRSKLRGEEEIRRSGANWVIARTAWLFGPWSRRNFVDTMIKLTADRESVDVVDDQFGSPTYSLHLAEALLFLARSKATGVFHAAGRGRTTWHGLASRVVAGLGRRCRVNPVSRAAFPRPAPRPENSSLDGSKLRAAGFEVPRWESGVDAYLRDFVGRS
jgi:dTDP-4-dehydrorhamnose reductase